MVLLKKNRNRVALPLGIRELKRPVRPPRTVRIANGFRAKLSNGLTLAELCEKCSQASNSNSKPFAAITFDDGLLVNLTVAAPILRQRNLPATVFVCSNPIGGLSPDDWGLPLPILSESQILRLQDLGFEIASHTVSYPRLTELVEDQILTEMEVK